MTLSSARERVSLLLKLKSESPLSSELSKDLEKAKDVLERLLQRVSRLRTSLEPFERGLSAKDFEASDVHIRGTPTGFICLPTALSPGDPLNITVEGIMAESDKAPSLIKAADDEESRAMCDRTIKMLEWEMEKTAGEEPQFLIVLRWSDMFEPLEKKKTGVIGKRYLAGSAEQLKAFVQTLKKAGIAVLFDDGEYGGGALTYELVQAFGESRSTLIAQLTLSRGVITDNVAITRLLESLSSF